MEDELKVRQATFENRRKKRKIINWLILLIIIFVLWRLGIVWFSEVRWGELMIIPQYYEGGGKKMGMGWWFCEWKEGVRVMRSDGSMYFMRFIPCILESSFMVILILYSIKYTNNVVFPLVLTPSQHQHSQKFNHLQTLEQIGWVDKLKDKNLEWVWCWWANKIVRIDEIGGDELGLGPQGIF